MTLGETEIRCCASGTREGLQRRRTEGGREQGGFGCRGPRHHSHLALPVLDQTHALQGGDDVVCARGRTAIVTAADRQPPPTKI